MTSCRRIVIHHTHLLYEKIIKHLQKNDIVFFDDCLYSQYVFLKEHNDFFQQNNINCILGFSSGLYANEDSIQMFNVESKILHDACNKHIKNIEDADRLRNSLQEMNGFMKMSQLKKLLEYPFCHLALHGGCHLDLRSISNTIECAMMFQKDLDDARKRLSEVQIDTSFYVYPYIYAPLMSRNILQKAGFKNIVGSNILRISIENLIQYGDAAKYDS